MIILFQALRVVQLIVFIRVILTWIVPDPRNPMLRKFTEPVDRILAPFRVVIPMGGAMMDLGPLLFLLLIEAIMRVVVQLI